MILLKTPPSQDVIPSNHLEWLGPWETGPSVRGEMQVVWVRTTVLWWQASQWPVRSHSSAAACSKSSSLFLGQQRLESNAQPGQELGLGKREPAG